MSAPLPGIVGGLGMTGQAALSGDGRYVAFLSGAANLVEGDTNGGFDIFSRDMRPGEPTPRFALADLKIDPVAVRQGKPVTVTALVKETLPASTRASFGLTEGWWPPLRSSSGPTNWRG